MYKLLTLLILLCSTLNAQPPSRFYTKFGGNGVDIGYGVKQTLDLNYIIVGSTTSWGFGAADVYLLLVDTMGQLKWQKTFGGAFADVGKSVIFNPADSGFVITGYTASFGNGGYDLYLIRTDKNGNLVWQKSYGGLDWDFGQDLSLTSDGNIVACGKTYSFGFGKADGYIVKVNLSNGSLIWQKYYGGAEDDDFVSIKLTSIGNNYLAGNTKSYGDINNDFWMFKIGNMGDSIASLNFGTPNKAEYCYDFMEDANNKLVFCGSYDTSFYNINKNNAYINKRDLNGNYVAEIQYSGAGGNDKLLSVAKQKSNNNYFFSRSVFKPGFSIEAQPFLLDNNLNFINATTYVTPNVEETYDVISTADNGFVMVGYSNGLSSNNIEDVLLIKLDTTVLNAISIVGVDEVIDNFNIKIQLYYYNNKVFIKNLIKGNSFYQLFDETGKLIEYGYSNSNEINFKSNLVGNSIYLLRLNNNLNFKFISF